VIATIRKKSLIETTDLSSFEICTQILGRDLRLLDVTQTAGINGLKVDSKTQATACIKLITAAAQYMLIIASAAKPTSFASSATLIKISAAFTAPAFLTQMIYSIYSRQR
jgi:hypothetical protein